MVNVPALNVLSQRKEVLPSVLVVEEVCGQLETLLEAGVLPVPTGNLSPLLSLSETNLALENMEDIAGSLAHLPDVTGSARVAMKPPMMHLSNPVGSSSEESSVSSTSDNDDVDVVDFAKFDDAVTSWPWKFLYSLATKKPCESSQAIWKSVFGVRKPGAEESEKFSLLIHALRFVHSHSLKSVARLIHELM